MNLGGEKVRKNRRTVDEERKIRERSHYYGSREERNFVKRFSTFPVLPSDKREDISVLITGLRHGPTFFCLEVDAKIIIGSNLLAFTARGLIAMNLNLEGDMKIIN
jgi:hypothetical protein